MMHYVPTIDTRCCELQLMLLASIGMKYVTHWAALAYP